MRFIFLRSCIYTARESDFGNVEFVFQQIVSDLDHSFRGERFLCNDKTAIGITGNEVKSGKAKQDFLEDVEKRRAERDKSPLDDAKPKTLTVQVDGQAYRVTVAYEAKIHA